MGGGDKESITNERWSSCVEGVVFDFLRPNQSIDRSLLSKKEMDEDDDDDDVCWSISSFSFP